MKNVIAAAIVALGDAGVHAGSGGDATAPGCRCPFARAWSVETAAPDESVLCPVQRLGNPPKELMYLVNLAFRHARLRTSSLEQSSPEHRSKPCAI